jgi:phosphatidylserine decarboxylase
MSALAHNRSVVAREGLIWLFLMLVIAVVIYRLGGGYWTMLPLGIFVGLFMLFRDPARDVPPLPLGVLAPVDGRVLSAEETATGPINGRWQCVRIRCNPLGAYTVRAPIEGGVHCLTEAMCSAGIVDGLWLRSEENDDVILLFPGAIRALRPRAFVRFGERLGQGQRFAYLRLAPVAEVYLPVTAQLRVSVGQRVAAGVSPLADLRRS